MARPSDDGMEFRPRKKKAAKKKSSSGVPWGAIGGGLLSLLFVLAIIGKVIKGYTRAREAVAGPQVPGQEAAVPLPATGTATTGAADLNWGSDAEHRNQVKNNLKQIALALHNYHDVHSTFPAAGITREGDNLEFMSWTISSLPYLDQVSLYNSYDVSQAWNSPKNQAVTGVPLPIFLNPRIDHNGQPVAHFAGNSLVFSNNQWGKIRDLTDGTANTLLVGEVSAGFKSWADPTNHRDLSLGLGAAPDKFGSVFDGGCHILLADGQVKFLSNNVSPEILRALATPGGGEVVSDF